LGGDYFDNITDTVKVQLDAFYKRREDILNQIRNLLPNLSDNQIGEIL